MPVQEYDYRSSFPNKCSCLIYTNEESSSSKKRDGVCINCIILNISAHLSETCPGERGSSSQQLPPPIPKSLLSNEKLAYTIDKSTLQALLAPIRGNDPIPEPAVSSDEYQANYSASEKNILYDYVLQNTLKIQTPPELFIPEPEKTESVPNEKDLSEEERHLRKLEALKKERDLKRKRMAYRRKVSTKNKSPTEITREMISNIMEALFCGKNEETSQDKGPTTLAAVNRATNDGFDNGQLSFSSDHRKRNSRRNDSNYDKSTDYWVEERNEKTSDFKHRDKIDKHWESSGRDRREKYDKRHYGRHRDSDRDYSKYRERVYDVSISKRKKEKRDSSREYNEDCSSYRFKEKESDRESCRKRSRAYDKGRKKDGDETITFKKSYGSHRDEDHRIDDFRGLDRYREVFKSQITSRHKTKHKDSAERCSNSKRDED